jgi:hypothetical protein
MQIPLSGQQWAVPADFNKIMAVHFGIPKSPTRQHDITNDTDDNRPGKGDIGFQKKHSSQQYGQWPN